MLLSKATTQEYRSVRQNEEKNIFSKGLIFTNKMKSSVISLFLNLLLFIIKNVNGIISDSVSTKRKCIIKDSIISISLDKKPDHVYYIDIKTNTEGEFDCKNNTTHGRLTCRVTTSDSSVISASTGMNYIVFIQEKNDFKKICVTGNYDPYHDRQYIGRKEKSDLTVAVVSHEVYRKYRIIRHSGNVFLGLVVFVIVFLVGACVAWKFYGNRMEENSMFDHHQQQQQQKGVHLTVQPASQFP